mmetsp:Transcript_45064/g.75864  ORF Transcript_45064/g.75864 Transcript_45064/m.75864 type:complete len:230 (+) Transcript_45064:250-939(+)
MGLCLRWRLRRRWWRPFHWLGRDLPRQQRLRTRHHLLRMVLPIRLCRHSGDHSLRGCCRAHCDAGLCRVHSLHHRIHLPRGGALVLEYQGVAQPLQHQSRAVRDQRLLGFRWQWDRTLDGWCGCLRCRGHSRAPHRPVRPTGREPGRSSRTGAGVPAPQPRARLPRGLDLVVRLVRLQLRLHPRRQWGPVLRGRQGCGHHHALCRWRWVLLTVHGMGGQHVLKEVPPGA